MTNYERIKAMSVEEMVEFLHGNAEYLITEYRLYTDRGLYEEQMREWLNSEVKNEM